MSKDEYLITDTPLKALTVFAMPMILGSFFQQIYNMADSIMKYLIKLRFLVRLAALLCSVYISL